MVLPSILSQAPGMLSLHQWYVRHVALADPSLLIVRLKPWRHQSPAKSDMLVAGAVVGWLVGTGSPPGKLGGNNCAEASAGAMNSHISSATVITRRIVCPLVASYWDGMV
jgi:hypothetical protein